jgi:hypothetical protein
MRDDEGDAAPDFIISAFKIAVQPDQIAFKVGLESHLVEGIALGSAAIKIGVEHRFYRQASIRHECFDLIKRCPGKGLQLRTDRTGS